MALYLVIVATDVVKINKFTKERALFTEIDEITVMVEYAPFRFSYLHLRTVIPLFRNKKRTFVYRQRRVFLMKFALRASEIASL